jgi:hypothetical protein
MVPQAFNPCYLGGKDQEDFDMRPPLTKSSRDVILKLAGCTGVHISFQLHRQVQIEGSQSRLA